MTGRAAALSLLLLCASACNRGGGSSSSTIASVRAPAPSAPPATTLSEDTPTVAESNPLGLPPMHVPLEAGRRVFTFSDQMLAAARPGATMALSPATVAGVEGDDLLIEGRDRPSYKVHPGYVIPVPDVPKLKIGDPVLTEHGGLMKHGVIVRFVKERAVVRFTDIPGRTIEVQLLPSNGPPRPGVPSKTARFLRQTEGLAPGNYAVLQRGDEQTHVLLVSSFGDASSKRWFVLGFGGAAALVDGADLRPIPIKWHPKVGSWVWAEWEGSMRRATVQSIDDPGLLTVKFERAGRPATSGWGLAMPAPPPMGGPKASAGNARGSPSAPDPPP